MCDLKPTILRLEAHYSATCDFGEPTVRITVSAESVAPVMSTKSRSSNSSVQIQVEMKVQSEFVPRDSEECEFLDLVDFGSIFSENCHTNFVATVKRLLFVGWASCSWKLATLESLPCFESLLKKFTVCRQSLMFLTTCNVREPTVCRESILFLATCNFRKITVCRESILFLGTAWPSRQRSVSGVMKKNPSHVTLVWFKSLSHVARMNESCHTWLSRQY